MQEFNIDSFNNFIHDLLENRMTDNDYSYFMATITTILWAEGGLMMTEETKQSLQFAFEVLHRTIIDNNCFVVSDKSGISVFDIDTYMQTGKFDGVMVDINSLVR